MSSQKTASFATYLEALGFVLHAEFPDRAAEINDAVNALELASILPARQRSQSAAEATPSSQIGKWYQC